LEPGFPTSKHGGAARRRPAGLVAAGLLVATGIALSVGSAQASDRWVEAGDGAVAILPLPQKASGITGGSLFCAEQRWSFFFRTEPGAVPAGWKSPAKVTVGGRAFEGMAEEVRESLGIAVTSDILGPLKDASRMGFTAGTVSANFSLIGSSAVIEAIAPRCSQVDMSAYSPVELSETSPDIETAKILLSDEARLFRAATGKRPAYAAAVIEPGGANRLLFASLCGSTSYYGQSGCTLTGYAAEGPGGEWQLVYSTEGLLLYTDPKASNGDRPNLVTLPLRGGIEPDHWIWNGTEYEIVDPLISGGTKDAPAAGDDEK
jgi:hypothetical protein